MAGMGVGGQETEGVTSSIGSLKWNWGEGIKFQSLLPVTSLLTSPDGGSSWGLSDQLLEPVGGYSHSNHHILEELQVFLTSESSLPPLR